MIPIHFKNPEVNTVESLYCKLGLTKKFIICLKPLKVEWMRVELESTLP